MSDVIASAVLEYTADSSGVSAAMASATQAVKGFEKAATGAGASAGNALAKGAKDAGTASTSLTREQERLINSIERYSTTIGKTRGEVLEFRAAQAGITDQVQAQIAAIRAQEAALKSGGAQFNKYGVTAGQTAAALRGVPAQLTDIVVGLQGGQAPLTVLLQQGGQLKDMFGGIVPAAKALGGALLGLINPYTVVAAAAATLAAAYFQGAKESENYNKALILTGNYLGITVSQLQGYATTISRTVGTQGAAAEALTSLANSGKVATEQLTAVGTAVVYMNRVLGTSIDDATQSFTKLADEPTKASAKLNESMHYLTLETYERIRALEEQGDNEAATAAAQGALASETTARLSKIEASAGSLERGWRLLADGAKSAWDAMLGVGRAQSIGERLTEAQGKLNEYQARVSNNPVYGRAFGAAGEKFQADVTALNRSLLVAQEKAIADGERARSESAKIAASDRLKKLSDEIATNASKRSKALKQLDADYKTLGKSTDTPEYRKQVADINEKFKDPKGGTPKAYQDDAATKYLEGVRQAGAALKAQLEDADKLTASEKKMAEFTQLIADLKEKKVLTAEQKSLLAGQDAIKAALAQNVALDDQIRKKEAAKKLNEQELAFAKQMEGITRSLESAQETRNEQYSRVLSGAGLGDRGMQELDAQNTLYREYQKNLRSVNDKAAEASKNGFDAFNTDAYRDEVKKIRAALDDALAAQKDFYAKDAEARANWVNGASKALNNYLDEVSNVAKQTEQVWSKGFSGLEDQLVSLVSTGKADFKSLADSIIADLARITIRQQIMGPLAKLMADGLNRSSLDSLLASNNAFGTGTGGDSLLSSLGSSIGDWFSGLKFFANGGTPPIGRASVVGERGPELFVPNVAGRIVPNNELGPSGPAVNVVQNFTVGDVASVAMVKQAVAGSEQRIAAGFGRSRRYGGVAA